MAKLRISSLSIVYNSRIPLYNVVQPFLFQGLTAIEAWMLACILFVFGALVEYAAILFRRQTGTDDHRDPVNTS